MSAIVPRPDDDGYWHYTYVTYHPATGEWYGGKHSTDNLDDGYLGSGRWVKNHPAREELVIEIVEFFYSEEHAYAAEAALIDFVAIDTDPLCRNRRDGGYGCSREANARLAADPLWQQRHREGIAGWPNDPEWRRNNLKLAARNVADPEWQRKMREVGANNAANPEWQKNVREGIARRSTNQQWLENNREANRRLREDPVWQQKNREVAARNLADPDWLRKLREGITRRNADPEYRRRYREGLIRREANRQAKKAMEGRPHHDFREATECQ